MYNSEQIKEAMHKLNKWQDRVQLIDKILQRREEIKKVKALQSINNLAPLFQRI